MLPACVGLIPLVSEILNRRRPLTLKMIQRLQKGLGIPAEILIQPYELFTVSAPNHARDSTLRYPLGRQTAPAMIAESRPSESET